MASFHCSVKAGAGGGGSSHAEYIEREGKYKTKDKEDLEYSETLNLPEWAESSAHFWEQSDLMERVNAAGYREFEIALPREMTPEQRLDFVREFIAQEIGDQHVCTFAIHNPSAALEGGEQPHAHIMFSARTNDGIKRSPDLYFKRWNAKSPERGGCKKATGGQTDAERKTDLVALRERFATLQNKHLEKVGSADRVTHLSLKDQGIEREPESHIGPRKIQIGSPEVDQVKAARADRTLSAFLSKSISIAERRLGRLARVQQGRSSQTKPITKKGTHERARPKYLQQPDLRFLDRSLPTEGLDGVQHVSVGPMVFELRDSDLLLPRDAQDQLGEGDGPDPEVRRQGSGPGRVENKPERELIEQAGEQSPTEGNALASATAKYLAELVAGAASAMRDHAEKVDQHMRAKPLVFGKKEWAAQRDLNADRAGVLADRHKVLSAPDYPKTDADKATVLTAAKERVQLDKRVAEIKAEWAELKGEPQQVKAQGGESPPDPAAAPAATSAIPRKDTPPIGASVDASDRKDLMHAVSLLVEESTPWTIEPARAGHIYIGAVVWVSETHIFQRGEGFSVVAHDVSKLQNAAAINKQIDNGQINTRGTHLTVTYGADRGVLERRAPPVSVKPQQAAPAALTDPQRRSQLASVARLHKAAAKDHDAPLRDNGPGNEPGHGR